MDKKVNFITTVYNEEKTIVPFLNSLFSQTSLPDEVIIVDAGSSDSTISRISEYLLPASKKKYHIKLIIKKGNRSLGRNTAIRAAKNNIIACSDVGCILDKNWLKEITAPFNNKEIEVVAGYYKPIAHTIFEKCLATYTSVMPDKIDPNNFLPSSRSVAFRKSAWQDVGGYPENLDTCEDLIFATRLKKLGKKFTFVEQAFVFWPQRNSIIEAAKQFFSYARGDGKAHYFRKQTPFLFLRYILFFVLLFLAIHFKNNRIYELIEVIFVIYLLWAMQKNYKYINHPLAFIYLPILQITADLSVMLGTIIGFIQSLV